MSKKRKMRRPRVPPTSPSAGVPKRPRPDAGRTPAEALADEIIALVQAKAPSLGGKRGDAAGQVMHGAFVYGFRRFAAIRNVAGRGEGAEAMILTRSLLSMVARAAYVDEPDDIEERKRRFEEFRVTDLRERLKMITDLVEIGFDTDDPREELRAELKALEDRGLTQLPRDEALLAKLHLRPFYARLYRPSSEHVHFSLAVAIREMRGNDVVMLEQGDRELADEALRLAIITYGTLLELSESSVSHGLHARIHELARPVLGAKADDTDS